MRPDKRAINHSIDTLERNQMKAEEISGGVVGVWRVTDPEGRIVYQRASALELVAYAAGLRMGIHLMMQHAEKRQV
jgi:hypothetical protein